MLIDSIAESMALRAYYTRAQHFDISTNSAFPASLVLLFAEIQGRLDEPKNLVRCIFDILGYDIMTITIHLGLREPVFVIGNVDEIYFYNTFNISYCYLLK